MEKRTLSQPPEIVATEPRNALQAFDELLKRPAMTVSRGREASAGRLAAWLFAGGLVCSMLYGAAAGFFQGGREMLLPALKAPLIVLMSVVLCLPSFYIISSLSGAHLDGRRLWISVSGFVGMIGLLMLGLVPVVWLFSVSSTSIGFVTWLHVVFWIAMVAFAGRFLLLAVHDAGGENGPVLWVLLFIVVSFQVATFVRPVLWLGPGGTIFRSEKLFFIEHLDHVMGGQPK